MAISNPLDKEAFSRQVFINCPFDDKYQPMFEALVFVIIDCGFAPRCAKEVHDSGEVRIQKIIEIIRVCRFGIHDLSRIQLSQRSGLPRLNMALELGLFQGAKTFGNQMQKSKASLILDKDKYRYQSFLSDLAGHDISAHNEREEDLITAVRKWLVHYSKDKIPGESKIMQRYTEFKTDLPALCRESSIKKNELTYIDYQKFVASWITQKNS